MSPFSEPGPWAPASPPTSPTPAFRPSSSISFSQSPHRKPALDAALKSKPAAFFTPEAARLITPGTFDDDLAKIKDCDWIIEAVSENLSIKRALYDRLFPPRTRRHRLH